MKNKKNLAYIVSSRGLRNCKGKYIYFNNNDLILQKKCCQYLVQEIKKDKNIGMVANDAINYYNTKIVSGGTWVSRAMYCGHHPTEDKKEVKIVRWQTSETKSGGEE